MNRVDLFGKYVPLRILFFGFLGAIVLLQQDFLLGKSCYGFLIGYAVFNGILYMADFHFHKEAKRSYLYWHLLIGGVFLASGVHLIVFARYLVSLTPVLLSSLLLAEGVVYFAASCRMEPVLSKRVLMLLAAGTLLGSLTVLVFAFGFGAGGAAGLTRVSGGALLIACLYSLVYRFLGPMPQKQPAKGETGT